jgi:putative membrane protein
MMHYWNWNWGMNLWMLLWYLMVVAILALAFYGVVALVTRGKGGQLLAPLAPDDPLRILKQRYARGEISEEEYRRMREELKE